MNLRIAGTCTDSIVDGPGVRFTVFVQGCLRNCPGCHNPQTHDVAGGYEVDTDCLIAQMQSNPLLDGLTISGGEPFLQPLECAELARKAHQIGLNVWCYTGYTLEELQFSVNAEAHKRLLEQVDVLVDGEYRQEERSLGLPWRGSRNQRIIRVTDVEVEG